MRHLASIAALPVLLLLLTACGSSDSGGGGGSRPPSTDVTGIWDVTFTVTGGDLGVPIGSQYSGTLTLVQSGMDVSGAFPTPGGSTASLEGLVVGQALTFTITEDPPCSGTATGDGTIDADFNRIDGSTSGTDCNGTVMADFVALRH